MGALAASTDQTHKLRVLEVLRALSDGIVQTSLNTNPLTSIVLVEEPQNALQWLCQQIRTGKQYTVKTFFALTTAALRIT